MNFGVSRAMSKIEEGLNELKGAIIEGDVAQCPSQTNTPPGGGPRQEFSFPSAGGLLQAFGVVRKWLPHAEELLKDLRGIFG